MLFSLQTYCSTFMITTVTGQPSTLGTSKHNIFPQLVDVSSYEWCNITFIRSPLLISLLLCTEYKILPQKLRKRLWKFLG